MLNPETQKQILKLARQGTGRNQIAKQLGISTQTVSKHVSSAGITFERSASEQANKAWQTEAKTRRTVLGQEMLGDLEQARVRLAHVDTARDFQLTAQGIDALTRSYVNLVKLEPTPNGLEEAREGLGGLLAIIKETVHDQPRLN